MLLTCFRPVLSSPTTTTQRLRLASDSASAATDIRRRSRTIRRRHELSVSATNYPSPPRTIRRRSRTIRRRCAGHVISTCFFLIGSLSHVTNHAFHFELREGKFLKCDFFFKCWIISALDCCYSANFHDQDYCDHQLSGFFFL